MNLKKPHDRIQILLVSDDSRLSYLLNRYAEQCGLTLGDTPIPPDRAEIERADPDAIIFSSLEVLRKSQAGVGDFGTGEAHILVCAAIGEEASARELGADQCIFHPLTYERFCEALAMSHGR